MPFEKGQSGNPAGRRQGSRNKVTLAIEELLDGEADALTRKVIDLAKAGDMVALRLCLDRIFPPRKDRPITFTLPTLDSAADAAKSSAIIVQAVASGELTPSEAADLSKVLDSFARTLEATDFEKRLAKLEQVIENNIK
jgi:Family of unknown function (DUF5681)